jgi:opacity protein-like surface antigen
MKQLIAVLLIALGFTASAQEVYTSSGRPVGAKPKQQRKQEPKGFDWSRIVVGGTLGFGMGDNTLAFSIAPVIGYRITDKLAAGIGFGYQYYKQKDFFEVPDLFTNEVHYYDYKASMISASVWARYLILDKLFVHAEYEHNFFSFNDYHYNSSGGIEPFKERLDVPSVLLGVGYRQPISENASMYIMAFYDVLQREYSPYKGSIQPRIGFTIGF